MGLNPGTIINGKFKTFYEMSTEELEKIVFKSQLKKYIVMLATTVFITIAVISLIY